MEKWDAIIIGGGLAGSATAIQLANLNQRVLLIEKEKHAHDKVCGEFISIEAQYYLTELGIDLRCLNAVEINYVRLTSGDITAIAKLPFCGMSISRRSLDEAMLNKAIEAGCVVRRGLTVTALTNNNDHWEIHCKERLMSAQSVFLATGKHDVRGHSRQSTNNILGFKMHFRTSQLQLNQLAGHVELFLFNGGYAGFEPIENGLLNLCLVISKKHFKKLGNNWDSLLKYIARECPLFRQRLENTTAIWPKPLAISGIPYGFVYKDRSNAPNFYRLGDQVAVIHSFCGDGMAIALHTAKLAVKHALNNNASAYHDEAYRQLLPQIRQSVLLAFLIKNPLGRKILVWLCKIMPGLIRVTTRSTRLRRCTSFLSS